MGTDKATDGLLARIRRCDICADRLPLGPRPIVQLASEARLLIAGQAPGRRVHETGVAFDDASGDTLRTWMGIDRDTFYDAANVAIVPMGFCFPGTGKSGDLPPDKRCASSWRREVLESLRNIRLTLVIGQYAQSWHFGKTHSSVTDTVQRWRELPADTIALPHPSPRNRPWRRRNPWFEADLLPDLRRRVAIALGQESASH
ncbi:MAG: uracil-DNA glycosylase family protein [Pseudomonadota bacterium]